MAWRPFWLYWLSSHFLCSCDLQSCGTSRSILYEIIPKRLPQTGHTVSSSCVCITSRGLRSFIPWTYMYLKAYSGCSSWTYSRRFFSSQLKYLFVKFSGVCYQISFTNCVHLSQLTVSSVSLGCIIRFMYNFQSSNKMLTIDHYWSELNLIRHLDH